MKKILIIEDDKALNMGILLALKHEDIVCIPCFSLKEAREAIKQQTVDLVLLDINLPDGNGLDFLPALKRHQSAAVILLTANDLETDIVTGLTMGADDYVTKPFSLAVLRARIQVQLRRGTGEEVYQAGDVMFDFSRHLFQKAGRKVELSRTEERILQILVKHRGTAVPRERIQSYVWSDGSDYVEENALSVAINRLRGKLDAKNCIKTIYGIGYCWEVDT